MNLILLTKVLLVISFVCFVCFFALMIAYHTESRNALAEQLREINRSKDVSSDVKDSMIRESSRLSGLAVAASFLGLMFGGTLIASVYLRWFGSGLSLGNGSHTKPHKRREATPPPPPSVQSTRVLRSASRSSPRGVIDFDSVPRAAGGRR